jgi:hypothetical protein
VGAAAGDADGGGSERREGKRRRGRFRLAGDAYVSVCGASGAGTSAFEPDQFTSHNLNFRP